MKRNTLVLILVLLSATIAFSGGPSSPPVVQGGILAANNGSDFANPLLVPANIGAPTNAQAAASHALYLPLAGGTVTGKVTLATGTAFTGMSRFCYMNTGIITFVSGAFMPGSFSTAIEDSLTEFNIASAPFKSKQAGHFSVEAHASMDANAVGNRYMDIQVNGLNATGTLPCWPNPLAAHGTDFHLSGIIKLAIGDVVTVRLYQNCTGPLTIPAANLVLSIVQLDSNP